MRFEKSFVRFCDGVLEAGNVAGQVAKELNGCITLEQVEDYRDSLAENYSGVDRDYVDSVFAQKVVSQLATNALYGGELFVSGVVTDYTSADGMGFGWEYLRKRGCYRFYIDFPYEQTFRDMSVFYPAVNAGWEAVNFDEGKCHYMRLR